MPVEFRSARVNFGPARGSGGQNRRGSVTFPTPVLRARAVMNGFRARYTGSDHELKELRINIDDSPSIIDRTVNFNVNYLLGDRNFDDEYEGFVDVVVIADVI